ncbi:MAG: hypothetical protein ACLUNO_05300 [Oscillospiraceae bacterium]
MARNTPFQSCEPPSSAEAGQQIRVERDDVRHGHKRRQTGDDLRAYGGVVFFQMKDLFH